MNKFKITDDEKLKGSAPEVEVDMNMSDEKKLVESVLPVLVCSYNN